MSYAFQVVRGTCPNPYKLPYAGPSARTDAMTPSARGASPRALVRRAGDTLC